MRAAAALALLVGLASAAPAQPQSVEISGVVLASANGEALARVRVNGPGDARTYPDVLTDDRGRFTLRTPAAASIALRFSKAGFAQIQQVVPRESARPVTVRLEPGGVITGRLMATSGVPVRGLVFVHPEMPGSVEPVGARSDDRGEFRVGRLPAGRYIVTAAGRETWTMRVSPDGRRVFYEARIPVAIPPRPPDGGQRHVVSVRDGVEASTNFVFDVRPPKFGDVELGIPPREVELPGGAISGTVIDERGEPMQGVVIRAQQLRTVNGRTVALLATDPVETDDRGAFRVFGLLPGEYVVAASITAHLGEGLEYGVWYPFGVTDLDGTLPIRVEASDVTGVSVTMQPAELLSIGGTVTNASGAPASGSITVMVAHHSGRPIPEARSMPLSEDGSFRFTGLRPGDYVLQANAGGTLGTPAEFGVAFVTLGATPPAPVLVRTALPATVSGRIIAELADEPEPSQALTLRVIPADPDRSLVNQAGSASLVVQSDGTFYITRLAGRNRIVLQEAPDGWYMKQLVVGGTDVARDPFDFGEAGAAFDDAVLVMSSRGAVITGQAEQAGNAPPQPYRAVVFPTDSRNQISRSQFIKHVRASEDGTFRVTGLPPGSYFVAAVRDLMPPAGIDEWQPADLAWLASQATRVTIAEGETLTVRPRLATR